MKLVVLDGYCLNPGDLSWDGLRQLAEVEVHDRTSAAEAVSRVGEAELVMTNKTPLDAGALARLPRLRYIGVLATGYNIVDVAAAKANGVVVTNVPTYGTASVAQHAFALLLELCHHVGVHGESVRGGEWSRSADWCYWKAPLMELAGKTMGIIGFGRIGRQTGKIADAMGMRVIANDTFEGNLPAYEGFRFASVGEVLRESDVISLHCPLTPENKGLINAERLRLMKPSAFLLNTSRGPLVVDEDLAAALNTGVIAGAGLDVLSVEPPVAGNPLFTARNCIVTPHIAWATREARTRLMEVAVSNLAAFLQGAAVNVVG
ncbi:MAG: D-2-hydroxyacid dehydrogenase [Bryobacterales bacterium]|nr:D-2-hydroxyacid dehydrogenase [Bryobacterales bacterium]